MRANEKFTRVALYGRVSTIGHGQDVGMQIEELRAVAKQRGWNVAGEYIDEGVSGSTAERPALTRLMAAVHGGKVDVVMVWKFDRFARSVQHLLSALEDFRKHGVAFMSVRECIDTTTAAGKMVFTFLGAVAEFERAMIVERVQTGVDRARAAGKALGRPKRDLDLRAAQALLGQGHSIRAVAGMLGVPRGTLSRRLADAVQVAGGAGHPAGQTAGSKVPVAE